MKWLLILCAVVVVVVAVEEAANGGAEDVVKNAAEGAGKDAVEEAAVADLSKADPLLVNDENDEDFNPNFDRSEIEIEAFQADDGAKNGKPLPMRSPKLEKNVRFAKLDRTIKDFNKIVEDSEASKASALKAIEKLQGDVDAKIGKRLKESNKRLNRIKDNDKRNDLGKKLTTEVDKANASIKTFLDQQKAAVEKLMTADDLIKSGVELLEKVKQYQKSVIDNLTLMGPKMLSTIQSSFAKASSVMDEISKK